METDRKTGGGEGGGRRRKEEEGGGGGGGTVGVHVEGDAMVQAMLGGQPESSLKQALS